jgi:ankyrin repeat protein
LASLCRHFSTFPEETGPVPPFMLAHLCPSTINELVRHGHKPTSGDLEGNNVLHHWVRETGIAYEVNDLRDEISRSFHLILSCGIGVDDANEFGNTPLHVACLKKNLTAVRMLIGAGANPNCKNQMAQTPIFYALAQLRNPEYDWSDEYSSSIVLVDDEIQMSIIKVLKDAGADFEAVSSYFFSSIGIDPKSSRTLPRSDKENQIQMKTVKFGPFLYTYGFGCLQ